MKYLIYKYNKKVHMSRIWFDDMTNAMPQDLHRHNFSVVLVK